MACTLVQIDDLGIMTWDEEDLIKTIESGGGSNGKGGTADNDEEEEKEKEVMPKPKK